MTKKRFKKDNKYFNTYSGGGLLGKFAKWNDATTDKFMESGTGTALGKLGISKSSLGGITNAAASTVSGLINPSGNSTGVGNALQGIGSIASNIPGVGGAIGAGVNLVGGLVNAAFGSNLNKEFISQTEDATRNQSNYISAAKDNTSLLSDWSAYNDLAHVSKSQVGSDGWFSNKAKNKAKALNKAIDGANFRAWNSLSNTAFNVDTNNDMLALANYSAYGGPIFSTGAIGYDLATRDLNNKQMKALGDMRLTDLPNSFSAISDMNSIARNARKWHSFGGWLNSHGGDFTNGVTFIDNGGSHEANPFEGVQVGIDQQGIPNLVEEGEVIFNDYVFSDRMKLPKKLKEKYSINGETFADAAKELSKESEERPNDPISRRGLEAFMNALAESQEEVRIKSEDKKMNRYAKGGKLGKRYDGTGNKPNKLNTYSNFTPLTDDSFYTPEYMNFWNWYNTNQNTNEGQSWLNRINSGEFGTIGGNTFTPQDIIRLSHDYKKGPVHNAFTLAAKQYNKENTNTESINESYNPYTKRWIREKGADGVWRTEQIADDDWNSTPAGRTYLMRNPNLKEGNTITSDKGDKDIYYDVIPENIFEGISDDVTEVEGIRQNPLRYAPLIGSGIAVLNDMMGGNNPDYSNADLFASAIKDANRPIGTRPIGEYLPYKPLDRMFYINQLNKNAAAGRRAIQNTTGGNRAASLAGILASDYNYGENLGQLARQAEEYNQAQRERVTGFNRQTNMFNSEQGTKVDMFNSELAGRQASLYGQLAGMRQGILNNNRAEKSANLTNFIQGLGDLGKELTDRDTLRWLADIGVLSYNTKGQYTGGNNTAAPKRSKGGKINKTKKKGHTI